LRRAKATGHVLTLDAEDTPVVTKDLIQPDPSSQAPAAQPAQVSAPPVG
jgi:hypothetical protein